jgi:hypothetical protein
MFAIRRIRIKSIPAAGAVVAGLLVAAACQSPVVVIQVKKPPDIDPSVYRRVAVLPFRGEEDDGLLAAKAVREKMEEKDIFIVEPAETLEAALDRVDSFDPLNRDEAVALGKDLGADAVIAGEVEFLRRTYSPEGDIRNELYTPDRQNIAPFEFGSGYATRYLDVNMRLSVQLTVKVLDVRTGRLMRRREFEATTMRTYKQREVGTATSKEREIFEELLEEVADDFIYTLEPHDVAETREVAIF